VHTNHRFSYYFNTIKSTCWGGFAKKTCARYTEWPSLITWITLNQITLKFSEQILVLVGLLVRLAHQSYISVHVVATLPQVGVIYPKQLSMPRHVN
jgi:hypothetical protein